jgi:protein-disulfide isomerase
MEEQVPQEPVIEELDKPSRPNWVIWLALGGLAVFACAAVFVGALIFAGPKLVEQFLPENIQQADQLDRTVTESNTMGDPNAPVHIIEYGDFQCPYCYKFWDETEPSLITNYVNTGKVYFEYRSVGPFLGPESGWAAEGAYCAGDQGKFWEYHDILFINQTGENVGDFEKDKLVQYADTLHLDVKSFKQCLDDGKYTEKVNQDAAQADADGVHATPTLLVNGYKVEGAQPYDVLQHIIEELLSGQTPGTLNG